MTNPWSKSTESDVLYPDDLPGAGLIEVMSAEPVNAEDVPAEGADYGRWAEVRLAEDGSEKWMAAPKAVRVLIGEAFEADEERPTIEVHEAERGEDDHDPWQVKGRVYVDGDPV